MPQAGPTLNHKYCTSCLEDCMHCASPKKICDIVLEWSSPCSSDICPDESVERVVLCKLDSLVKDYIDPLQFAYRRNRSTDDAVLYVLENIYSHLEKGGSSVRLMFFDFSSAFNTTQSHLLVQKILNMKLLSSVISWIFDYLTNRLQHVRMNGVLSSVICTNTGAPQGTVLAPFLFSLYTADCRCTDEI